MNQDQHILPQVYLKEFGFQDEHGRWKVKTFSMEDIEVMNLKGKNIIKRSNIKSLLKAANIYDIEVKGSEKLLENFFQLSEDNYAKVLKNVRLGNQLTKDERNKLLAFISHLFVRTSDYRNILGRALKIKDIEFLKGICQGDELRAKKLVLLSTKTATNLAIGLSAGYIYQCLSNFRLYFIVADKGEKWATTDNPVLMKCKAESNGIIEFMGVDSKIISPLSSDILAFIDHGDSTIKLFDDMIDLKENCLNSVSQNTFEKIWMEVTDLSRIHKYLIIPTEENSPNIATTLK